MRWGRTSGRPVLRQVSWQGARSCCGAFSTRTFFSFAGNDDREDVNVSIIQPIVNFSLPNHWSIGTSEMNITYD
jgi:hypothetical protein